MPTVLSINVSNGGIPKLPVDSCAISYEGLAGDGRDHQKHIQFDRAVSLIDKEILEQLTTEGYVVPAGAVGENLTVENLNLQSLEPNDRLTFSGGVVIELAERRKPCFVLDPLGVDLKKDIVGRCGYLARVITEGLLTTGETIEIQKAD
ncbi:MAG TPA: MOSC domain-containing protein [Phycisphaerales bacterium]|nr:MOSC domain-containing protein [Phycisphaerales bacterium]HIO19690.1 MOSC domain-containing protein [Phycisphaerales bacterium]HIO53049.1 MOSC domain-containing protein [Phycisphaerales bacterium]